MNILKYLKTQSNFKIVLKIGIDGTVLSKNYLNNKDILTNREKDVLNEVGKGLTNKKISENLHMTEYTVKKHVGNILDKLQLKNRQKIKLYIKQEQ